MQPTHHAQYMCNPGTFESTQCAVCGSECLVRRSVNGPTSFAMAVGKLTRLHDVFTCPHLHADWHEHAAQLHRAIQNTPSPRIAALMQLDLDDVLKANLS
jgi:hypothetical protein